VRAKRDAPSALGEEFRVDGRNARRLLDPSELKVLTELDDRQGILAPLLTFSLLAACVAVGLWGVMHAQRVLVFLSVMAIATQQHALFVLSHEAAHYRMLKNRRLNDLLGRVAGTLGGVSMCTYRVTHRLHHNHLYGAQDPDIALNGGYPRGGWYLTRKLLIDLTGWTAPKTFAYFFGAPAINAECERRLNPLNDTSEALRQEARRDRRIVIAFQLALPMICLGLDLIWGRQLWVPEGVNFGPVPSFLAYVLLWLLPLTTFLQVILRLRAVAEHGAPAGYDSPLQAARTNLTGRGPLGGLLRLVFFPHHVNFHIEHHLYPSVPHYRLRATHELLLAKGALTRAEVRPFEDTLKRVFMPKGSLPESIRPRRSKV
jgi:fatty acid desaturase